MDETLLAMPTPIVLMGQMLIGYIPHGHCYLWQTPLVSLHVVSDLLIALAYGCIAVMLVYFVRKRYDTPFKPVLLLFGAFIAACGVGICWIFGPCGFPTTGCGYRAGHHGGGFLPDRPEARGMDAQVPRIAIAART
jgi:hypothetical protein